MFLFSVLGWSGPQKSHCWGLFLHGLLYSPHSIDSSCPFFRIGSWSKSLVDFLVQLKKHEVCWSNRLKSKDCPLEELHVDFLSIMWGENHLRRESHVWFYNSIYNIVHDISYNINIIYIWYYIFSLSSYSIIPSFSIEFHHIPSFVPFLFQFSEKCHPRPRTSRSSPKNHVWRGRRRTILRDASGSSHSKFALENGWTASLVRWLTWFV